MFSAISILSEGVVAQLGERLNGIQEVGSSILPSSTRKYGDFARSPLFCFFVAGGICSRRLFAFIAGGGVMPAGGHVSPGQGRDGVSVEERRAGDRQWQPGGKKAHRAAAMEEARQGGRAGIPPTGTMIAGEVAGALSRRAEGGMRRSGHWSQRAGSGRARRGGMRCRFFGGGEKTGTAVAGKKKRGTPLRTFPKEGLCRLA